MVRSRAVQVSQHGIKCLIFVSRSTTIKIALNPKSSSSPVTKSIVKCCHGWSGIFKGLRVPYGACRVGLALLQVWQSRTYLSTSFRYSGRVHCRLNSSSVLATPGCPEARSSWCCLIKFSRNSSLARKYRWSRW